MDRAAKEALKRFPDVKREDFEDEDEFFDCLADRNVRRLMWREGYRQAEKDTIERAIQWLIAHADDYIVDMEVSRYKPSNLHVGGMCWEHLKKAMEEE